VTGDEAKVMAVVPLDVDCAKVVDEVDCTLVTLLQTGVVVVDADQSYSVPFVDTNACVHTTSLGVMRLNGNLKNRKPRSSCRQKGTKRKKDRR
jgi:hypothetical protein